MHWIWPKRYVQQHISNPFSLFSSLSQSYKFGFDSRIRDTSLFLACPRNSTTGKSENPPTCRFIVSQTINPTRIRKSLQHSWEFVIIQTQATSPLKVTEYPTYSFPVITTWTTCVSTKFPNSKRNIWSRAMHSIHKAPNSTCVLQLCNCSTRIFFKLNSIVKWRVHLLDLEMIKLSKDLFNIVGLAQHITPA